MTTHVIADTADIAKVIEGLEFRRMFSGEMDPNNCYLDIQAGSGGTEAQDWAKGVEDGGPGFLESFIIRKLHNLVDDIRNIARGQVAGNLFISIRLCHAVVGNQDAEDGGGDASQGLDGRYWNVDTADGGGGPARGGLTAANRWLLIPIHCSRVTAGLDRVVLLLGVIADLFPVLHGVATRALGVVEIIVTAEGRHGCLRTGWKAGAAKAARGQGSGAGGIDAGDSGLPPGDFCYRVQHLL